MPDAVQKLSAALLGRYVIERELGAGGMATVYLAQDVRHDRKVALKVLRPELSAILGADRFLAEIKTTANLQHPHILSLYDSGEADGVVFYVMPYVEGESLRDRLRREHQLPVEDAARIAGEVLAALDYAHRHGVVHRDIKPENILLHDGSALVADFGIALAVSRSDGGTRMTETGMSLGTPHYMAPEQAMGEREITPRADVYATGCVLYEMLAGEPPFTGPTAQAIVARVMTEAPRSLTIQRHTIPPHIEAAVHCALEKLPADRFATAALFAEALAKPGMTLPATRAHPAAAPGPRRWPDRLVAPLAAASVVMAGLLAWALLRPAPDLPVARYAMQLPPGQEPLSNRRFVISPGGEYLAYTGTGDPNQIWLKPRDRAGAIPLAGTTNATAFVFSPDGQWLAFVQQGELKKVSVNGGAAITLSDSVSGNAGAVAWLDDGSIAFIRLGGRGIWRMPDTGGERVLVWRPDSGATLTFLAELPGGRGLLVIRCRSFPCGTEPRDLWAVNVRSGEGRLVQAGVTAGAYVPTGHVLYVREDGAMLALPFDLGALAPAGPPVPVRDSIGVVNRVLPLFAVSANGTLLLRSGGATDARNEYTMVWVDRGGRETVVDSAWTFLHAVAGGNAGWSLSPEGRRVAIGRNTEAGDDIWVKALPRGPVSRITFDPGPDLRPRWSHDGRWVLYHHFQDGSLRVARADGSDGDSMLLDLPVSMWESAWTRDGRLVVRMGGAVGVIGERSLYLFRPGTDTVPVPLVASERFDEAALAISPDERWIAYEANETGRPEIYVRPFPAADGGKLQVSNTGGRSPVWSRTGRELFFVDGARNMVSVPVGPGVVPRLGEPRVLFRIPADLFFRDGENYTQFDVAADGRFLMARLVHSEEGVTAPLLVTENWFTELRRQLRGR